jgi:hypothetical protein
MGYSRGGWRKGRSDYVAGIPSKRYRYCRNRVAKWTWCRVLKFCRDQMRPLYVSPKHRFLHEQHIVTSNNMEFFFENNIEGRRHFCRALRQALVARSPTLAFCASVTLPLLRHSYWLDCSSCMSVTAPSSRLGWCSVEVVPQHSDNWE